MLDKSNDLIYGIESCVSIQHLHKQDERIYDGSTNTSVDSYVVVLLFPTPYIPNNVEYSRPIGVEPGDTIVIPSTCLGIAKSGSED